MTYFLINPRTKHFFLFLGILILSTCVYGQDIDRKKIDATYVVLPAIGLPQGVETYATTIKSRQTGWGNSLGNTYDGDKIFLNGYYRLSQIDDADLIIETEVLNDAVFDQAYANSVKLTYKRDKNSPEIEYIAYYYNISYYTPKIAYRAYTKKGQTVFDGTFGGQKTSMDFGNTSYDNHFSNSSTLGYAWQASKRNEMARVEKYHYDQYINAVANTTITYSMYQSTENFAVRYVDEKKGKTEYQDTRDAADYFLQAIDLVKTDKISLINKLVQPNYEKRRALLKQAIDIWEKDLAEADFENKKARIDAKVGRHLYYNLALAYYWMDDFAKAREYAQGRKKDVGGWDKNFLSGIGWLSKLIDVTAARHETNKWRNVMLTDDNVYVYKDPATRKREADELLAIQLKARNDSIASAKVAQAANKKQLGKTKSTAKGTTATKAVTPVKKSAMVANSKP